MFKIEDIIFIKNDLIIGKQYGNDVFASGMEYFLDKKVIISEVHNEKTPPKYYITGDENNWYWTEEMFMPAVEIYPTLKGI